ncbi:neurexin-4 isoform X2 [Daktulosphaira vitifoliae]|uniref:neurexin-4 isoform X2 n=1 Tax=Daktulosphaira vitifoliae TaxID=58002 RepID=UPI0021A9B5E0|nr:neurexin-4 isoform X2 [Daktulosphaira vitifoliae]
MMRIIAITYFSLFTFCEIKADSDCNEPLLDKAVLRATSSLPDRGPENARLNGHSAWSPSYDSLYHSLIIEFSDKMKVCSIEVQGRSFTLEFVTEYFIQFSDNGQGWKNLQDIRGDIELFKGNANGDDAVRNTFSVPIIAQWIRINPTRWRDRISLRLELYGCPYASDNLYFNGSSLVRWNLRDSPVSAHRETIRFRFKTNVADGVLLYGIGSQGDYLALQLRDNRLLLNINLGSQIMTSLSIGSLLDDNIWHEVIIMRNKLDVEFSVDRVTIEGRIKGEFERLDLNHEIFIGGVPHLNNGLVINKNFTGCIENLHMNSTNMIYLVKEAYNSGDSWLMQKYQKVNTLYTCLDSPIIPVTFLTQSSHALIKSYEGMKKINISLSFRTYEEKGMLAHHKFLTNGHVKLFLENGSIMVELVTKDDTRVVLNNYEENFNDGRWHSVILVLRNNFLELNVDNRPMQTIRKLDFMTGTNYLIAGGVHGSIGFIGCMRLITVDGNYMLPTDWKLGEGYCCEKEILFDACQMIDRCNPNPCRHGGTCKQNSNEFFCICSNTGYGGAVCQTPLHPLSCRAHMNVNPVGQSADITVDVDGSGPLKPFPVTCQYYADGRVVTLVRHQNEGESPVDGYQEPGGFSQDFMYEADIFQIEALVNRSHSCWQSLSYSCKQSRLFNSPANGIDFRPFGWWVSRHNQKMDYWGGSIPGSYKCQCGVIGDCKDQTKWCNCDSGFDSWLSDSGDIREKEHLPIKKVQFGDTGTPLDEKEGRYKVGPLMCEGDDLFNNVITFRKLDSQIRLPTFDFGQNSDIYFEFKTTIENAVIFESHGPKDFIKFSLISGHSLQFTYQAGSGPLSVRVETSDTLNDDRWHSVLVERNRKESRIIVNGALRQSVKEPPGPVRAIHLTSPFIIGASSDEQNGFIGCMRAFMLNGQLIDLRKYAEEGLYGISPGCIGKCDSSPCLNNGTCFEKYDGYSCDCRWTAFKGPICADEIGVTLKASSMIRYDFEGIWRSTISENIRVGFTTTNPKGFLLGLFSNISGEYMTIMVSNSGHLRVVFDFGFERQELIFPEQHFGLGQYHDLRIKRKNSGSTLVMEVDGSDPKEFHFNIKDSTDAQFNNIQYMYIGRNASMTEGFVGCISRVEFDDIYPLKLLFQQDGPPNVSGMNTTIKEDFCGVEPVTHPQPLIETRPPPILDEEKVKAAYNETNSALIGGVFSFILLAILILAFLVGRYVARHKGDYITQEDRGADIALDPDDAVIHSTTGHQVQKKREWFI